MFMQGENQMARTKEQPAGSPTPGFAIKINDDTELGLAILVAEFGDSAYQPIGVVVSINEAHEIAASDMRGRMRDIEASKAPACPEAYVVWAQGLDGDYRVASRFMP
jgi:hypothetical protein